LSRSKMLLLQCPPPPHPHLLVLVLVSLYTYRGCWKPTCTLLVAPCIRLKKSFDPAGSYRCIEARNPLVDSMQRSKDQDRTRSIKSMCPPRRCQHHWRRHAPASTSNIELGSANMQLLSSWPWCLGLPTSHQVLECPLPLLVLPIIHRWDMLQRQPPHPLQPRALWPQLLLVQRCHRRCRRRSRREMQGHQHQHQHHSTMRRRRRRRRRRREACLRQRLRLLLVLLKRTLQCLLPGGQGPEGKCQRASPGRQQAPLQGAEGAAAAAEEEEEEQRAVVLGADEAEGEVERQVQKCLKATLTQHHCQLGERGNEVVETRLQALSRKS